MTATEAGAAAGQPHWHAGLDARPFVVFRVAFGLLMTISALRFVAKGWIHSLYVDVPLRFPWPGFGWVPEPSAAGFHLLFGLMAAAGLAIAAGWQRRLAAALCLVCFLWVEVLDLSTYLNHYYLVSLLLGILAVVPPVRDGRIPRWALRLLQGQVAVVYLFAGLAKLNPDWLLQGEPLHTWLSGKTALPLVGPWLAHREVALAMSWAGCLYDLSIAGWLAWRPTRALAWMSVAAFHLATALLFPIGIFPWLMMAASTLFWEPERPRPARSLPRMRGGLALAAAWMLVQTLVPLRHWLLPGDVAWTEAGTRFSWRVMLHEKTGFVEFTVVDRDTGRRRRHSPRAALSQLQLDQMSFQPDLIVQYARQLAAREQAQGRRVAVLADAFLARNGRPSQRWIDPTVDLTGPLPRGWICPEGASCPPAGAEKARAEAVEAGRPQEEHGKSTSHGPS